MVAKGLIGYKYRRRDLVDWLRQSGLDRLGYRCVRYHLGVVPSAILMKMNVLWLAALSEMGAKIRSIDVPAITRNEVTLKVGDDELLDSME